MDHVHMTNNQRVNHFRNHYEVIFKISTVVNKKRFNDKKSEKVQEDPREGRKDGRSKLVRF
jgi:hypothetical protein